VQSWREDALYSLSDWRARRVVWASVLLTGFDEGSVQENLGNVATRPESAASAVILPANLLVNLRSPAALVAENAVPDHVVAVDTSFRNAKYRNIQSVPSTLIEAIASSFVSHFGKPTAVIVQVQWSHRKTTNPTITLITTPKT
jgi:hypothetical protein